eukprot:TRINITY_DN1094_c0_g1_i6.p1 TRINITY_DN1094_c0_g1~~TRINITY_DN1094_c0_g1_i6.p1  ORF type:complete len:440 (+),score=76.64 TRINITY_DN1094_c0_g1_i6:42-1322(+)
MVSSIHDFEMREPIGNGAFGTVYRVVRKKDKQEFAMKAQKCKDTESLSKCMSEANKMVVHPNLVECKDIVLDETKSLSFLFYIMMPLYDGTLEDYCDSGPLDDAMLLRLLLHIGRALAFLHDHKSCVHRDVKPGNILYKRKPVPTFILGDFGLAKEVICEEEMTAGCGTPFYMPRKQRERHEAGYGKEVDMYALGMTAYRARTSVGDLFKLSAMLDEGSVSVRSKVEGALGDELGGLVLGLLADRPTPASTLVVTVEDLMLAEPTEEEDESGALRMPKADIPKAIDEVSNASSLPYSDVTKGAHPGAGAVACPYCGASESQTGIPLSSTTVNKHKAKCSRRPGSSAGEAKVSPSLAVPSGDGQGKSPNSCEGKPAAATDGTLGCPHCKATQTQRGKPIADGATLNKHLARCPVFNPRSSCSGSGAP